MAERMGADMVAAPGEPGIEGWFNDLGLPFGLSDAMAQAPELKKRERAVLFDCVGKPGMIMGIGQSAPVGATIVVVGTCMETDPIEPAFLLQKSLQLRFVFAYSPGDFAQAFQMICAAPGQPGRDGDRACAADRDRPGLRLADRRRFRHQAAGRAGMTAIPNLSRTYAHEADNR